MFITIDFVFVNNCFFRTYFRLCGGRPTGALNGLFFGDGPCLDGECFFGEQNVKGRLFGEFTIYTHARAYTRIKYI